MLMFISFATIVNEWVELGSLAFSSRNDAVSDKRVLKYSKSGSDYQPYFQGNYPVLLNEVRLAQGVRVSLCFSLVYCFIV